jgi:UDP-N-acetylmuramate--alanine ligase
MREELVRTLADCLCSADLCLLLPIYYAGGTTTQDISSEQIAAEARGLGAPAEAVGGRPELVRRLADCARPGDAVLVMGARDDTLTDLARDIAAAIAARRP